MGIPIRIGIGLSFSGRLNPQKSIQADSSWIGLDWIGFFEPPDQAKSIQAKSSRLCIVGSVETTNRTFQIFPDEIVATVSYYSYGGLYPFGVTCIRDRIRDHSTCYTEQQKLTRSLVQTPW